MLLLKLGINPNRLVSLGFYFTTTFATPWSPSSGEIAPKATDPPHADRLPKVKGRA